MRHKFSIIIIYILVVFVGISTVTSVQYFDVKYDSNSVQSTTTDFRSDFKKFIVITWDGVRPRWLREYSDQGDLSSIQSMRKEGGEVYLDRSDTPSSTDPLLATIETGFGPRNTTIISNQFGVGTAKRRIPDGYQTSERLKSFFGDEFKTGHMNSWVHHPMNETIHGLPNGNINQREMLDSIFLNAKPGSDVDYWFGSENISWKPTDTESHQASFDEHWWGTWINGTTNEGILPPVDLDSPSSYGYIESYSTTYDQQVKFWQTPLINAQYLANRSIDFIQLYKNNSFYLRVHMTEPDHIGHEFGESLEGQSFNTISPEYFLALEECDTATGKIRNSLIDLGIYNDTFFLTGTDHSFLGQSHSEEPTLWISNQPIWSNSGNDSLSPAFGLLHDIQPTILALAGADWSSINYLEAKPVFLREYRTSSTKQKTSSQSSFPSMEYLVIALAFPVAFLLKREIKYKK